MPLFKTVTTDMYRLFNFWNAESKMQPITNRGQRGEGGSCPPGAAGEGGRKTASQNILRLTSTEVSMIKPDE